MHLGLTLLGFHFSAKLGFRVGQVGNSRITGKGYLNNYEFWLLLIVFV